MAGLKCPEGCTCKRHTASPELIEKRSRPRKGCEPGCTCKRHSRVISEEHRAKIIAQNKARAGKSHRCPPDCTCKRHQGYYFGGSKPGRKVSEEARRNIAEAARNRTYTPEGIESLRENRRAQNADPEFEKKRIAALREALTGTFCPPDCTCQKHSPEVRRRLAEAARDRGPLSEEHRAKIGQGSREWNASVSPERRAEINKKISVAVTDTHRREREEGKVRRTGGWLCSRQELALIPYLEALGYQHNTTVRIGRKLPDFIDDEGKRIFEYFGSYWHPEPQEEQWAIEFYRQKGYECTVLWEWDLFVWLRQHQTLVSEENHELAWRAAQISSYVQRESDFPAPE